MDEREYKRLDKKRKLKTASGYNCAKEIVAQTAIIADDYDKLKRRGLLMRSPQKQTRFSRSTLRKRGSLIGTNLISR